jgi:hypothetical protein
MFLPYLDIFEHTVCIVLGQAVQFRDTIHAEDGRLKRLAARDILDQHVKFRELDELTRRIEAIEERLARNV